MVCKNGQIKKNGSIGAYIFENLRDGDLIYILQNRCLISILAISIEKRQEDVDYVHPAMWNPDDRMIPSGAIPISDKIIVNSTPYAYSIIRNSL